MPDTATTTPDRPDDPTPDDPTPDDTTPDDPTPGATRRPGTRRPDTIVNDTRRNRRRPDRSADDRPHRDRPNYRHGRHHRHRTGRPPRTTLPGHPVSAPARRRGRPGRRNPGTTADTTVTTDKTDAAGPVIGTSAESAHDRVWAALRQHPGTTAAALADTSGVARSTVAKLLAAWSEDGSATSAAGATARAGRRWTAAPSERPPTCETNPDAATPIDAPDTATHDTRHPDRATRIAAAPWSATTGDRGAAAGATAGRDRATPVRAPATTAGSTNRSGTKRLAAGALQGMVQDYLSEHPGRTRPHRDRTRVGTFLGRDRQRAQTPRRRRMGRAGQRPTPALPPRRTPRRGCRRLTAVPSAGGPLPDAPCGARPAPRRAARAAESGTPPRRRIHPLNGEPTMTLHETLHERATAALTWARAAGMAHGRNRHRGWLGDRYGPSAEVAGGDDPRRHRPARHRTRARAGHRRPDPHLRWHSRPTHHRARP